MKDKLNAISNNSQKYDITKKYFKIFLLLVWCVMIFMLSNQKAEDSTKLSNGLIINVVEKFDKDLSEKEQKILITRYDFIIRKIAHFTIYFILGILIYNVVLEYSNKNKSLIALIFAHLYSLSDEVHQAFIIGRSCELRDIIIDTLGALIGIYFIKSVLNIKNKKKKYDTI